MAVEYLEARGYTVIPPQPIETPPDGPRDGDTYEDFDYDRLNAQSRRVFDFMHSNMTRWVTLAEISGATGDPEASVSARLRDFRKSKFGKLTLQSQRVSFGSGEWEYKLGPSV